MSMQHFRMLQVYRVRKGGNEGGEAGNGSRKLTRQISCECVHCVGFLWPKITILGKFWLLGGSCTDPFLPMKVKFGVLKQTKRLHLHAKFHVNVFIVSASGGQKTTMLGKFWRLGAPVSTPYYRWGPNLVCYSWPIVHVYVSKFVSSGLFYRHLVAKNPNFCRFFWTSAFSDVDSWRQSEKVEHGCTTTNLPLSNGSKSFLYFNVVMVKSGAQTPTFKSVTPQAWHKKRDGQTKNSTFFTAPAADEIRSPPNLVWR